MIVENLYKVSLKFDGYPLKIFFQNDLKHKKIIVQKLKWIKIFLYLTSRIFWYGCYTLFIYNRRE